MDIAAAQADLRRAYVGGGPGAFISGLVWLAAAAVERAEGIATAFVVLFFGGWLIFPLSTLVVRLLFRRAGTAPGNPLAPVALESTIAMIGGLVAAWLFLPYRPDLVLPLAAIAVGTHYAVFKTAYGDPLFYALAALLTGLGAIAIFGRIALPGGTALAFALVELGFGVLVTARAARRPEG